MGKRKLAFTTMAALCIMEHQIGAADAVKDMKYNELNYAKTSYVDTTGFDKGRYIIGPGDILSLDIFDAPNLSQKQLEVLNDGSITLPLIGSISIEGMTINEVTTKLRIILGTLLLRPEITLTLRTPRPIRIALMGEIEQPGLYTLGKRETIGTEGAPRVSVSGLPTVVDAIQKGGGITNEAKLNEVILQRKKPGDKSEYKQTKLDLIDLMKNGNQKQNPFLFDGDIIKIPRDRTQSEGSVEIAAINLSPQTIRINVIGEVEKPGKLVVDSSTTLNQAILLAGGEDKIRVNINDVQLVRINRDGTAILKRYKLDFRKNTSNKYNPILRNGDTIRINRNLYAKAADILSEAAGPISDIVTAIGLYNLADETFNLELKKNVVLFEREIGE